MAGYITGKCALYLDSGEPCQEDATFRCTTCARPMCVAHLRIGTLTPECSDCGASHKTRQRKAAARWTRVADQLAHSSVPRVDVNGRPGWLLGDVEFASKGGWLRRSHEFTAAAVVLADSGPEYPILPVTVGRRVTFIEDVGWPPSSDAEPKDLNSVASDVEALLKRRRRE